MCFSFGVISEKTSLCGLDGIFRKAVCGHRAANIWVGELDAAKLTYPNNDVTNVHRINVRKVVMFGPMPLDLREEKLAEDLRGETSCRYKSARGCRSGQHERPPRVR